MYKNVVFDCYQSWLVAPSIILVGSCWVRYTVRQWIAIDCWQSWNYPPLRITLFTVKVNLWNVQMVVDHVLFANRYVTCLIWRTTFMYIKIVPLYFVNCLFDTSLDRISHWQWVSVNSHLLSLCVDGLYQKGKSNLRYNMCTYAYIHRNMFNWTYNYSALLRQRLYRTSEAPLKLFHVYYNLTIYVLHTNR